MKKYLSILSLAVLLTGCYSRQGADELNAQSFTNPVFVGEIKGQKLYRMKLAFEGLSNGHEHYVYFFDNNPVVSINHDVPEGKTTANMVEVFLNGKPIFSTNLVEDRK